MKKGETAHAVLRQDYTPYPWSLRSAALRFEIDTDSTRVFSSLVFEARADAGQPATIDLDGMEMELVSIARDGSRLDPDEFETTESGISVNASGKACTLDIEVLIRPDENTALDGLYRAGDFLLRRFFTRGLGDEVFDGRQGIQQNGFDCV